MESIRALLRGIDMSFSISVTIDTRELDRIAAQLDMKADEIVKNMAFKVEGNARALAPVDTGALSASMATEHQESAWYRIGPTVGAGQGGPAYAIYQELGFTHWISGQFIQNPYLTPAVEMIAGEFLSPATWQPLFT